MVHQVNKQRSIDEIGYARRLEIQQAMAERKTTLTIHSPSTMVITDSVSYIQPSPEPYCWFSR